MIPYNINKNFINKEFKWYIINISTTIKKYTS